MVEIIVIVSDVGLYLLGIEMIEILRYLDFLFYKGSDFEKEENFNNI